MGDDILDMRVLRLFNFAAVAPVVLYLGVDARSEARDRISHVYAVENPIINTRNQQVEHDSSFDLIFSLQNEAPRVKLSLEPNHNILGGKAYVEYLDGEGKVRHAEPIDRSAHRVFKGKAWIESVTGAWLEGGWARVYVKRDGASPLVEGAFSILGNQHHIQLQSSYMQTKRDTDFHFNEGLEERMVVYRDSDMASVQKRDGDEERCQSDQLAFNVGPENPLSARAGMSWNSASLGSSSGGGGGDSVSSWVDRNRNLVIGLSAGLGSLVLIILACCICSCCRKRNRRKAAPPIPPQRPMMGQQWGGPPPPAYPSPAYTTFMNRSNPPLVRYA